jgi:hypothetical protein
MTYDKLWEVLEILMLVLQKKSKKIPVEVLRDLKSAKTLINVSKAESETRAETIMKIETYLSNVETYLLILAEELGKEFADEYLKKIHMTRIEIREDLEKKSFQKDTETKSRFISGIRRDEHWIRIKIDEDIKREFVEEVAEELDLNFRMQNDGFLLVHGDQGKIKRLVRKIADETKKKDD